MPVANVGSIGGGVAAFEHATSDDGKLYVCCHDRRRRVVVAVDSGTGALRACREVALVRMRQVAKIEIETRKSLSYELDGGARTTMDTLRVGLVPHAVSIRVVCRATG